MSDGLLTEDEIKALMLASVAGVHPDGLSKEKMMEVVRWAEGVRMDEGILLGLLSGTILADPRANSRDKWKFQLASAKRKKRT